MGAFQVSDWDSDDEDPTVVSPVVDSELELSVALFITGIHSAIVEISLPDASLIHDSSLIVLWSAQHMHLSTTDYECDTSTMIVS